MSITEITLKEYLLKKVGVSDSVSFGGATYSRMAKTEDWLSLKKFYNHLVVKRKLTPFTNDIGVLHSLVLKKPKPKEYKILINDIEVSTFQATEDDLKDILDVEGDGTFYEEDIINKPNHYHRFKIEVIEIIKILIEGNHNYKSTNIYYIGNVIKYVFRAGLKGDFKEDLRKARYYLDKIIEG